MVKTQHRGHRHPRLQHVADLLRLLNLAGTHVHLYTLQTHCEQDIFFSSEGTIEIKMYSNEFCKDLQHGDE